MTQGSYKSEQEVFDALKAAVSSGVPSDEFVSYLKDFQLNKLTTGTIYRPPSFHKQLLEVHALISRQLRSDSGYRQVIKQINAPNDGPVPCFFTTLATMFYVLHEIEVTNNIGYDPMVVETGIRAVAKVSYAEIVVGDELVRKLSTPPTTRLERRPTATITLAEDRFILAIFDDGREGRISRKLSIDARPHKFIKYLLKNSRTSFGKGDIEIATGSRDITELINQCGFDKNIKPIFFPNTNELTVYFDPSAQNLSEAQVKLLLDHKWEKVGKNIPLHS
jgi:hypothetical protein